MDSGGVFPAEMPERGRSLVDPLDADTAERLVAGRVGPDDAPPGYAGVAGVLQAAAGPAGPEELAGREAALALFRVYGPSPGRRHRPRGRPRGQLRGRLAALALAGALAAGGLWMAAAAPPPAGLPSRARAPQSGGAGSERPDASPALGPGAVHRPRRRGHGERCTPPRRQAAPAGQAPEAQAGQAQAGAAQARPRAQGQAEARAPAVAERLDAKDRAPSPDSLIIGPEAYTGAQAAVQR